MGNAKRADKRWRKDDLARHLMEPHPISGPALSFSDMYRTLSLGDLEEHHAALHGGQVHSASEVST